MQRGPRPFPPPPRGLQSRGLQPRGFHPCGLPPLELHHRGPQPCQQPSGVRPGRTHQGLAA
eukprot:10620030-Alexandrium_andersonii.AAC.1